MSNEASRRRGPATEVAGFFNGLLGVALIAKAKNVEVAG